MSTDVHAVRSVQCACADNNIYYYLYDRLYGVCDDADAEPGKEDDEEEQEEREKYECLPFV